jgi:hypothetical protein
VSVTRSLRWAAALATAIMVVVGLSACFLLPSTSPGESENPLTPSIDSASLADEVTATSGNIEKTEISTERDGLTYVLYVRPTITTAALTSQELDALLRVAYSESLGEVSTIEVRTVDVNDDPVDLTAAADELGIHYLANIHSITYSTESLKKSYA